MPGQTRERPGSVRSRRGSRMQIDDRLRKNNKAKNRKPDPPEEEDTLTYATRQRSEYLNGQKSVFDTKTFRGINSDPSVFDRTASFKSAPYQR